jgi:hypothetical protein
MIEFDHELFGMQLTQADDLEKVERALIRERVIRQVMADSGECREVVAEALDAQASMDQEGILDLTDGDPTTLHAALQLYVDELEKRDELQPRDRVLDELGCLLTYPWPGVPDAEALAREIHTSYTRLAPARGFSYEPWERLTFSERETAVAVSADLIGRGIVRKPL